jgi:predicted O-methyltransferase YrrM
MNNKEIQGWCTFEGLYDKMVSDYDNAVFVEVGCWLGQSAIYMADLIKERKKNIKFYTVDNFKGQPDERLHETVIEAAAKRGEGIFSLYYQNIQKYNVLGYVTPIICESSEGFKHIKESSADFIYIDANHLYDAIKKDVEYYWPFVKNGGVLAGHDYCEHVKIVVDDFVNKNNLNFEYRYDSWIIRKT